MNTMNKHSLFRFLSLIAVMVLAITAAGPAAAQSAQPVDVAGQCYQGQFAVNAQTGLVNSAGANSGKSISAGLRANSESPEAAARSYLDQCGSLFGLTDQAAELTVKNQTQDNLGRSVIRFQQVYQGVLVFSGEFLVQVDGSGNVVVANGDITPAQELDVQASFDSEAARQVALELAAQENNVDAGSLEAGSPSLNIYNPALLGLSGTPSLVWRVDVTPLNIAPIREVVLVDAASGEVAYHFNNSDSALQRYTYNLGNSTSYPGTLVCADPTACTASDNDVYYAHYYSGATYNYYYNTFGRDSIDNAGMALYSYTHYSSGYCNAFWNGSVMTYGDGCLIVQDDVVGHEMSHGVTEYTSNLTYSSQSGAINESWSDIMGKFVAFSLRNDSGNQRWLVGGDVPTYGPFRDMQNPPVYGQPDKMSSPYWYTGSADNRGVHTNSGVGNKTAYLMTDGGTFNGYTVTGIGWAKTARIFYYANVYLLTASSNYAALGTALNQACANLTGSYGITEADCANVRAATVATEISSLGPTLVSPSNLISAAAPTFYWNPVSGATQYQVQVIRGAYAKVVFDKVVSPNVCAGTLCSKKSTVTLPLGNYSWHVRAYVGDMWQHYSGYFSFTVAPAGSVMSGYWRSGSFSDFTVVKYNQVKNFSIVVNFPGCTTRRITHVSPTPTISSKKFSFSGPFHAKGTFTSITSAYGTAGLTRFGPVCGYYWSGGPWSWSSIWHNSVVPTFTAEPSVGPNLVEPAPQEQSDFTVERVK